MLSASLPFEPSHDESLPPMAVPDLNRHALLRMRPTWNIPQGEPIHFNTNIFDQKPDVIQTFPLPVREAPPHFIGSVEYLHKLAGRNNGRYPKLGLFVDTETFPGYRPESFYETSIHFQPPPSPSPAHEHRDSVDYTLLDDSEAVEPLSEVHILEDTSASRPLKRKAVSESVSDSQQEQFDLFAEDASDDDSDCGASSDGSEYFEPGYPEATSSACTTPENRSPEPVPEPEPVPVASKRRKRKANDDVSSYKEDDTISTSSSALPFSTSGGMVVQTDDAKMPYFILQDGQGKIYQCRTCPNHRTRAIGDMTRHLESLVHRPQKAWVCEPCRKNFTRKDALKRHVIAHHSGGHSSSGRARGGRKRTPVKKGPKTSGRGRDDDDDNYC